MRDQSQGIDLERLYTYRFREIGQPDREEIWSEIARWVYQKTGRPLRVLDPAAGRCEFINSVPAAERWAVDLADHGHCAPAVKLERGDAMSVELPRDHFDLVWISNFLEHLGSQHEVGGFLRRMHDFTRPGGRIAVLGPNYAYTTRQYFDFADHVVPLSHKAIAEHLYAAGFESISVTPRFLPCSFTGRLPAGRTLVRTYLRMPLAWRVFGKQFLAIAVKHDSDH